MQFLIFILICGTLSAASGEIWRSQPYRVKRQQHQLPPPSLQRVLEFLQRKNIYRTYNMNRALEEWRRLSRQTPEPEMRQNLKEIINTLLVKATNDYMRQRSPIAVNATGNSVVFRSLLKFFAEAPPKPMKYAMFPFLYDEVGRHSLFDLMSLDDAIVFAHIWNQEIIDGGLIHDQIQGPTSEFVSNKTDKIVRNVVRAANRIYPPGQESGQPLTVSEWWLRQRQNSTNVYKVYHLIDALVQAYRKNGLETATIYEALVDEYKKSGRPLDAYELNMIDYLAYRLFGFIENADPDRW